jgi:hypothetical protein
VAEARFYNPYDRSEGDWDYGFGFRSTGKAEEYRLFITSKGAWFLYLTNVEKIADGQVKNLDLSSNGSNDLRLVVRGDAAYFFVNDEYVATLDVSEKNAAGDVWVGTGFFSGYELIGKSTRYEDLTIWSLP